MLLYDLKGIYWSNMLFSIVVSEKKLQDFCFSSSGCLCLLSKSQVYTLA